jgi:hypothetical protein
MSGTTFQPPINIDPSQDAAQQVAFINQNFQSIASALQSNSFRILEQGEATIYQSSHNGGSVTTIRTFVDFSTTYETNPIVLAFIISNTGTGDLGNLWGTGSFVLQQYGATTGGITFTDGIAEIRSQDVSESGVIFIMQFLNGTNSSQTNNGYTLQWYAISTGS